MNFRNFSILYPFRISNAVALKNFENSERVTCCLNLFKYLALAVYDIIQHRFHYMFKNMRYGKSSFIVTPHVILICVHPSALIIYAPWLHNFSQFFFFKELHLYLQLSWLPLSTVVLSLHRSP